MMSKIIDEQPTGEKILILSVGGTSSCPQLNIACRKTRSANSAKQTAQLMLELNINNF